MYNALLFHIYKVYWKLISSFPKQPKILSSYMVHTPYMLRISLSLNKYARNKFEEVSTQRELGTCNLFQAKQT